MGIGSYYMQSGGESKWAGATCYTNCSNCGAAYDVSTVHVCTSTGIRLAPFQFEYPKTTPHKCPCCDGWGQRNAVKPIDNVSERLIPCSACNGSGVIWG